MSQKTALLLGLMQLVLLTVLGITVGVGQDIQAAIAPTPTLIPIPDPVMGDLDLDAISRLDLRAYPVIPEISENARMIYLDGLAKGNNPHTFIKVGDCMTHNPYFLIPIGQGLYALGEYEYLEPMIEYFGEGDQNPFSRESQAAAGGFNAASVLDSMWANPEFCEAAETPLSCEFREMRPSLALVMFGTNDVYSLSEAQFDFFLRSIIVTTVRNGTLPILSTFPNRPEFPEKSILYNQIVVQIALDYDLPMINLWLALEALPNQGVDAEETTRMSVPEGGAVCYFIDENMQAGFTVRNLVTLQTLGAILQVVSQDQ